MQELASQAAAHSPRRAWLEVALVFVVCFVAGGAPAPHVNEAHYLAKAKHYWQPDWCPHDPFLESGNAHLTFTWTVGWWTQWLSLPAVAWIGRSLAWLGLAFAWQRLSRSVSKLPFQAVLSAMLLVTLVDWTEFSGEWIVGGVEGKAFAYALVCWGLVALAEGKWQQVWPRLGLASAFHVLVGGWSVLAALAVWCTQPRPGRPPLLTMGPALVVGGLLALPGLLPALLLTDGASAEVVDQANEIYVFQRLPHHLAPLTQASGLLETKALRFGLLLVGFVALRFFCLQQPLSSPEQQRSLGALERLMRFAVAALLISLAGLVWELATWNQPALAARLLKFYFFRLADIALPLATSLMVGWLTARGLARRARWALVLLTLAVVLPSAHLLALSGTRHQSGKPPAARKLKHFPSYLQACAWAQQQTPTDALFLVPQRAYTFKWYAGRSDLVTWKDIPQNAPDVVAWYRRFLDIYPPDRGVTPLERSLAGRGTTALVALTRQYQVDYLLTRATPRLALPVAYTNRHYTIYSTSNRSLP